MSDLTKAWVEALRLKTLPAGTVPVLIGGALAYEYGKFHWGYFLIILLCALLIQTITNFLNEIYDFKKGADTVERLGPDRNVAKGIISLRTMYVVSVTLIVITFLLGLILVAASDIWILIIGILSLIFAYAYTGGPYPLAYNGLADVFVFIFFGLVAVGGTFYIFHGFVDCVVIMSGAVPGFLSANILAVNNIRDIEQDPKAHKMTLQVRLGKNNSQNLYAALIVLSYFIVFWISLLLHNYFILLPIITVPIAMGLIRDIKIKTGRELNKTLALSGKFMLMFGVLFSLGLLLEGAF
jgi:1,4-dihydroxy-2-naphthoate octaprenyltransferase